VEFTDINAKFTLKLIEQFPGVIALNTKVKRQASFEFGSSPGTHHRLLTKAKTRSGNSSDSVDSYAP
jgi:hypothetical protein